jgi:hypothetical protein
VTQTLHDVPRVPRFFGFRCRDCGSSVGFRSRPRGFSERYFLPIFLMQPVRCAECFRRDYRFIFTSVKHRLPEKLKKMPTPTQPTNSNVA